MLKKRIIPVQLLLNGRLVKTIQFGKYRDVGDPVKSSQIYNSQYADELILLNIDRKGKNIQAIVKIIEKISEVCFMPLSIGGGIRNFDDIIFLIKNGADKVIINSAAYENPELITLAAEHFGTQAVTVAIDVKRDIDKKEHTLVSHCGTKPRNISLEEHIHNALTSGAGEILIQSIDQDGTMEGFDLPLVKQVMEIANAPVIACGGSGNYEQLREAFLATDVSALACGSLFNFSDSNPMRAKNFLANYGLAFKKI